MGNVYRATDARTGRQLAVKINHTLTGSGKGTPYKVDISEERFAPKTLYSMHHYEHAAIVEFEEDKGAKTWKAKVEILAKPLTRADRVRLF